MKIAAIVCSEVTPASQYHTIHHPECRKAQKYAEDVDIHEVEATSADEAAEIISMKLYGEPHEFHCSCKKLAEAFKQES